MSGQQAAAQPPTARRPAAQPPAARHRPSIAAWWLRLTGSAAVTTFAFGLLVCMCALVAVAGPRANAHLRTNAFRELVARTPALDKTVIGTDDLSSLGSALNVRTALHPADIDAVQSALEQHLAPRLPIGPVSGDWDGLTTPFTPVEEIPTSSGTVNAEFEFAYRSPFPKYVRVVAGSLPGQVSRRHGVVTIPVAVTRATAKRFGYSVGSGVFAGGGIRVKVGGIVAPRDARAPFWTVDPLTAAPAFVEPLNSPLYWQAALFMPAAALAALQAMFNPSSTQLTWVFPLALSHLTASQAISQAQTMRGTLSTAGTLTFTSAQNLASIKLYSGATDLLNQFVSQASAVGNVLDLISVSLAMVGAAVVLLTAWLMAEQRREEFAMLRARGASRRQLGATALKASAIAALPGAAIGIGVAVALTPGADTPIAWWLAGLTVLAALAGPVLITARQHRSYVGTARPDRPASRMSAIRRLVAESALILVCIGSLIVLREQVTGRHDDLVASAAPVLAAVPVAIIMLRLYPAVVRTLLRLATRRRGVVGFLGLARSARLAASAVLPAFSMVLALSLVSFAGMVRAAVIRGEVAQSWQAVGADAVVSTAPAALSLAQQQAVAAVPGAQATAPVAETIASYGLSGNGLMVLIANPRRYAALLAHTPFGRPPASFADWRGPASLSTASSASSTGRAGRAIPVLASPGLAAQFGGRAATVEVAGRRVTVRIVGTGPTMSQDEEITSSTVAGDLVLPASALGAYAPVPDAMLVAGPDLDDHALTSLVARWRGQGGSLMLRSSVLAGLESAPVQQDTYIELLLGGIAAAIGCLLVLLLVLLLSAQSRQLTVARTATMGLSMAQGRWLTLVESTPQLVAVLIGGLICALGLAPLVGPALDLAAFTGSATPVPVRIEPAWLAVTAIGLLVLAMATVSIQTMLTDREVPRSLRIGG
ncbi:MAG TPA: FtsX-like permease family protein [Streptosporangiaceae bacterium]|nr:FtsX-like permease family protein [Streptosporangiaceae bacterium]